MLTSRKSKLSKLLNTKPEQIKEETELVRKGKIDDTQDLTVISPRNKGLNLFYWLKNNFSDLKEELYQKGGLLFRDFQVESAEQFGEFIAAIDGVPMEYKNRSSPRSEVLNNIYTSTDYPKEQRINMHNEMDYDVNWPMKIAFYCHIPSETGGETPIIDSRIVFNSISEITREKFRPGIKYVRNLTPQLGLSVQEVFQTSDKNEIEQICATKEMTPEWIDEDHLRITWTRPAFRAHPVTGENVWFNHGYFFNSRTLDPSIHQLVSEENLPYNTYYANGSAIETEVIDELEAAYSESKITFRWQKGDVLLLDNMLMAHSRNQYSGERKILVAMCDPHYK